MEDKILEKIREKLKYLSDEMYSNEQTKDSNCLSQDIKIRQNTRNETVSPISLWSRLASPGMQLEFVMMKHSLCRALIVYGVQSYTQAHTDTHWIISKCFKIKLKTPIHYCIIAFKLP